MIRKFNYTGRKKVTKDRITIKLFNLGGLRTFNANVNLQGLNLPSDARIYIEPYYRTSFMRFPFGTVGHTLAPSKLELDAIPNSEVIFFRIKVVDEGSETWKLLAYADEITASNQEETPANKTSILPVNFEADDLDQEIWRLNFGGQLPTLDINRKIEDRKELIKSDFFLSLVYPSIIRQIAYRISDQYDEYEEGVTDWQSLWIKFFKTVLGVPYGPEIDSNENESSDENRIVWSNIITEAFCRKYSTLNRISGSIQKLFA